MRIAKRFVSVIMISLLLLLTVSVGSVSFAATKKVKSVKLNKTSITLYIGNTYKLTATVSPSNATNKKLMWSTSDKSVVTVASGKVTAKKSGTAIVTAKAKDGSGKKATCKVTVKKRPVKSVKLNKTTVTMYTGNSLTLKATVSPSDATNKKVTWKSSNSKVAVVNSKGKVTAKKNGTATISAVTADGKKKATCKITVKNYYTVEGANVHLASTDIVWIPVKGGTKFHIRSSCSNMINPKKVTVKNAVENGFSACKRCF